MALFRRAAQSGLLGRLAGANRAVPVPLSRSLNQPAADEGDLVLEVFQKQQKAYRDFLEGVKSIPVPLNLDPSAVKQYAQSMEALKRKVGIPQVEDVIGATLDHKLACSSGSVRAFLQAATEGVPLGDKTAVLSQVFSALDKVEAASGPAEAGNEAALKALGQEVQAIAKEHKLEDLASLKPQAIIDMYAEQLRGFRAAVEDEIEVAQRRDGLQGISVKVDSLKPKFA